MTYPIVEWGQIDPLLQPNSAASGLVVYRGTQIPQLANLVIFTDMPSGEIFYVSADKLPAGRTGRRFAASCSTRNGAAKTVLQVIQEKNKAQGKKPATRADLRLSGGPDNQVFLLNKGDGTIRVLDAVGPPPIVEPCYTAHRFRPLLRELLRVLRDLEAGDWQRPTLAPRWKVRDIAAHLLDNDLRKVSVYRDGHQLPLDKPLTSDRDLAEFVNSLNASGVAYAARLSPRLMVDLLEATGHWVADLVGNLPPHGRSIFAVSWAGEQASENWMDTGREYTERWHHQMQIREAVGRPLLLDPEWMSPLLDLSVRALPYAYRSLSPANGTAVTLEVSGQTNGAWTLRFMDGRWQIEVGTRTTPNATVRITTDDAWRLLYNALRDGSRIQIEGDRTLAAPLLAARSVIV